MTKKYRALVIGDDTRSFLSTVRSLGRKGVEVHAAPYGLNSAALKSRYIHDIHLLPYYLDGGDLWLTRMRALVAKFGFDIIIPCEERSLLPLYRHQEEFACAIAIPNEASLDAFFDKTNTRSLAERQDVPIAKGLTFAADDGAAEIAAQLEFPVIGKYRKSYSWPELYVRTSVKILRTVEALDLWLTTNRDQAGELFIEQMFSGFGLGVSVLCDDGSVLQAFEHHRVHELEGSSYYRKSSAVNPERLNAVRRMVADVKYTGLAMFEFKHNIASGKWILLEVNARPWGSLPLPVALGVDFPFRLMSLLVQGQTSSPVEYRTDVYGRNLISDLWQVRASLAKKHQAQEAKAAYLMKWATGLLRVFIGREHHDVLVLDDLRPGLSEIKEFLGERMRAVWPQRAKSADKQLRERWASRPDKVTTHLLFLCQGNICRSPYAEIKARQVFSDLDLPVTVESAGMLPRNSRPSPSYAIDAAARRGVDLAQHRSQHAFEAVLDRADLIVIFDSINRRSFLNRYPELEPRLCFLGEFLGSQAPIEIIDPDGGDNRAFDEVYKQIDGGIAGMAAMAGKVGAKDVYAR